MRYLKTALAVMLIFCALMFSASCKEETPVVTPHGIVEGSINITTENLPKIAVDANYSYAGYSLAAALLRVNEDTNLGTVESPKNVTDFVTLGSSDECFEAITNGKADIVIGFLPESTALDALIDLGITLKTVNIATEELVFFTGPECGVDTLTKEQIISIFNGSVTNWKDLGGNNVKISAFLPETDSVAYSWFEKEFGKLETTPQRPVVIYSTADGIFTAEANYDNRAGAISFALKSDFSNTTLGGTKTVLKVFDAETEVKFERNIVLAIKNGLESESVTDIVFNWLGTPQGKLLLAAIKNEITK